MKHPGSKPNPRREIGSEHDRGLGTSDGRVDEENKSAGLGVRGLMKTMMGRLERMEAALAGLQPEDVDNPPLT
jgi:hypothetical protein